MVDAPKPGSSSDDRPHRRGVPLADEQPDDLPALLVIAVGIAVIAVLLTPLGVPALVGSSQHGGDSAAVVPAADDTDDPAPEPPLDEALVAALDQQGLPAVDLEANGAVITARGEVADEPARASVIDFLSAQPGVEQVIDELTVATAPITGSVDIEASQASIVLRGDVPDQPYADELVNRANELYSPDQVDNQLTINSDVGPPISASIVGTLTDEVLHRLLSDQFTGIVGIDQVDTTGLVLEESGDLETALNSLEPVQFSSGSAVILSESQAILAEAAAALAEAPGVSIEISGHTDSLGSDASNQELSQARAESVRAALVELGVTNELVARGFGESRLKIDPDTTPEAQQENRRIEFRIVG